MLLSAVLSDIAILQILLCVGCTNVVRFSPPLPNNFFSMIPPSHHPNSAMVTDTIMALAVREFYVAGQA